MLWSTTTVWSIATVAIALLVGQWLWSRRTVYRLAWQLNGEWSLPLIGHVHKLTKHAGISTMIYRTGADWSSRPCVCRYSHDVHTHVRRQMRRSCTVAGNRNVRVNQPSGWRWHSARFRALLGKGQHISNGGETIADRRPGVQWGCVSAVLVQTSHVRFICASNPHHIGAAWRKHRKIIAQGFSESVVTGYLDMFNKHIGDLLEDIGGRCGRGEFNMKLVANVYLMNTVLDTTLGHDVEEQDKHTYEKFFAEWVIIETVSVYPVLMTDKHYWRMFIGSGQYIISKLVYQPWHQIELYWRFTKWPALLNTFNKLHNRIFDKVCMFIYFSRVACSTKIFTAHWTTSWNGMRPTDTDW